MEALFIYLLKSAGILTIFFLAYKFLLQKETFFSLNRHYLLGGIIASLLLPLVVFTSYIYVEPVVMEDPLFYKAPVSLIENTAIIESTPFNWDAMLFNIYILGIIIVSTLFLIQLFSLNRIIRSGNVKHFNAFKLVEVSEDVSPFSFFNYIIYNPENFSEKELEIILNHEKAHGKQLHSIDILLSQLFVIFQWFNPVVWLYKKNIQQNLEFLADKEAISNLESKKSYQHTLLKVSIAPYCTSITNNFYNSLIKKRIVMLNQTSSKTRNLWKYSIILPALAIFLFSFNTKEVTVIKDSLKTEFIVEPTSTKTDLSNIEDHFKSKDVLLKFKNIQRNNAGELTSISISTKYKTNKRFVKRMSLKSAEGKESIDAFKLNYNKDEQSFLVTRVGNNTPESKIMENTIKIMDDKSLSSFVLKKDTSLGDNPLYIINGKKVKSNQVSSEKMSLDGKIIQLNKKEGTEQYGEEGKDGVLIFDGKTSITSSAKTPKNDVIVKITKDTSKEELDKIQKDLREKGMEFSYSNVDYNSAKEITSIKLKYKDKEFGNSGSYHISGDDNEPIKPIYIYTKDDGRFGIGNSPDGSEHEERIKAHAERQEEHKARMDKHKERMYEHKLKMKEHNEKVKEEHEERMEVHKQRMEEHKAKMEVEHEVRMKEMKERHEEIKVEKEERLEEHKARMEKHRAKIMEEREERMHEREEEMEERKTKLRERKKKDNAFVYATGSSSNNSGKLKINSNGKTPLYIVNGKITTNGDFKDLNPNNIASVNVLKGKSAISLYGNKGKDGVVQVVTKGNESARDGAEYHFAQNTSSGFEKVYFIENTSSDRLLNSYKEKLKNQGVDFKFSGIKRNRNGEITRIKLRLDDNNGSKTSSFQQLLLVKKEVNSLFLQTNLE